MNRKALSNKILCLGIDGMDPMVTKRLIEEGKMPHTAKFVQRGAQRADLTMLGGVPTITPPMWTTLATGTNPGNHGITCFWNQDPEHLDTMVYAFDSRKCKNELLWNVFAEAGKKTLVWHWPGSSWPPTSDSPNLYVVDGTQPASINSSVANVDWSAMVVADKRFKEFATKPRVANASGAGCIIEDLPDTDADSGVVENLLGRGGVNEKGEKIAKNLIMSEAEGELAIDVVPYDVMICPIKPAEGWAQAPEGALEFFYTVSEGLMRRPCLILKNDQGEYDRVAIYRSKKDAEPLCVLKHDDLVINVLDECLKKNDPSQKGKCTRSYKLMDLAADGSRVRFMAISSMDVENDHLWHPKSLYRDVVDNVGYVPPVSAAGHTDIELVERMTLPVWDHYSQWQASALNYLMSQQGFEIVFSHIHEVDACGHNFWYLGKHRDEHGNDEERYQKAMEETYRICDDYIGRFYHFLDEGWTIFIFSDHGLLTTPEDHNPLIGDAFGCNIKVMQELGYTVLQKDENGNDIKEIDWSKTRAVATRGGHIWINLKGRNATGIVDPADKYELEGQIISDLYSYRFPDTGKRVISIALRNKDAVLEGAYGPECGDILYWLEEGYNRIHGDSLSTVLGYRGTSVSPIFIAAGQGLKQGYTTERIIREVDFAPTVAALGGVRMTKECEGAPAYQIFAEEF